MSPQEYASYVSRQSVHRRPGLGETIVRMASQEAELHDAILAECRRRGLRCIHSRMDRAATISVGAPDFVIALPAGRTLWVECKSAKGSLRHDQAAWLSTLHSLGHEAHLVRSFDAFLTLISPQARS